MPLYLADENGHFTKGFFKNFDGRFETLNPHGFLIFFNSFDLNN